MAFMLKTPPDKKTVAEIKALEKQLFAKAYTQLFPLSCEAYVTAEPVDFAHRTSGEHKTINIGDKWAQNVFDCAWFHITGEISGNYMDKNLVFLCNCGGEGLVYTREGEAKQAITCYASDFDRSIGEPEKKVILNRGLTYGHTVDFWIDAAANDLFGKMPFEARFSLLCAAEENTEIRGLYYDIQVLRYIYEYAENSEFTDKIYEALYSLPAAEVITEQNAGLYRSLLKPLLETKNNTTDIFNYTAVGHAHLDLAWLWPIRETKRKGARTFTTQIMNTERYPGYIFGASQGQLYKWIKNIYPDIFEQVKQLVKEGKWELQGATWVEPDSNLIGGESLIRQFYYGKRFFLENFGEDIKIFWVPDSFGYSACVPQIMKQAEVPYFLTMKLSWNTVTKFPHHSFWWQGLDGSTVLAHLLPDDTYNGPCRPDMMITGERNYKERLISDKAMMLFGIGDGGAGPGFEHIERLNRLGDIRQVPRVKPGKAIDFFKSLDDGVTQYPSYKGELYLERHRGTYTTRHKNKKMNRRCEFLLRNYEALLCAAEASGIAPPVGLDELDEIWQEILLYQFHDILPGSSINRVYDETSTHYDLIADKLTAASLTLAKKLSNGETVFNPTSFTYKKTFKHNGEWLNLELPALGTAKVDKAEKITSFSCAATENSIENDCIRIIFDNGKISSFYDKNLCREFVKPGSFMGVYSQYTDSGDCWDIKPVDYYKNGIEAECFRFETFTDGPLAIAEGVYKVGNVMVKQTVRLTDGSSLAEMLLEINSYMTDGMLRVGFDTAIKSEEAKFNLQFGHLSRRTTENTDAEKAQFEVSAQKFVDISDGVAGISLLNDCKYGFRCKDGFVDVDLIRTPKGGPGENVDKGTFTVRLALFPHAGDLGPETYKEAYILNNPSFTVMGTAEKDFDASFTCSNDSFIVETVKRPVDGKGVILRIYNASETTQTGSVSLGDKAPSEIVNILEHHIADGTSKITLKPFELINLRF